MFDKECDLLTCASKGKCLWHSDFKKIDPTNKNAPGDLSSMALRLIVLINQGHNTFSTGWNDAIIELVYNGKVEIFKKGNGYTIINNLQ